MRTLVIHPQDNSTTFLCGTYANVPDKTVITGGITKDDLIELLNIHDRIMLMGHGDPEGLFSIGVFKNPGRYVIDVSLVKYLKTKTNIFFIWCHADQFVSRYSLTGFYSGMFISEVWEGFHCGLTEINQDILDESNYAFAKSVDININKSLDVLYKNIKHDYGLLSGTNPVVSYNHRRLYLRTHGNNGIE